jgi:hypothetical protein
MIVYSLTLLDLVGDPILGNRRTVAIFTNLERAKWIVKNNLNNLTDDNFYQYAVIEKTELNTVRPQLKVENTEKYWFKYNTVLEEFEPLTIIPSGNIFKLSGFGIG